MANYADVLVKNRIKNEVKSINVTRKLPDGTTGYHTVLSQGGQEEINLQSTDVSLVIDVIDGLDTKEYWVTVKAAVDLETVYSRTNKNWTFKIIPNELEPEIPTTVNITIGDIEPDT